MKNKATRVRKFRGYAPVRKAGTPSEGTAEKRVVGVARGYGPRSAENVLEGAEVEPVKLQKGSDDAPRRPLTKAELEKEEPELRDAIKGIPWREPHPGPQFRPGEGSPAESALTRQLIDKLGGLVPEEQLYPDFIKARRELEIDPLMAAGGTSNVPKGFTSFWPGGGKWEGPSKVAAGSNILGGQPWQYYDIGNTEAPWIGLEGPRGTLGQWVDIPGQERRGRVIDVKQKGYGGFGILQRGRYDRHGNLIPGSGGEGGGGGGGIRSGPFAGWSPGQMEQWHSGAGPSGMGFPSFTGTTAGPGGQNLAYETTSYNVPGYGWVPRAQLANAQASNNFWDYMNPWGGTSKGGANTGDPTQRGVGTAVGTATNLIFPGVGYLTGPAARWLTSKIQNMIAHGASKGDVGRAVAQARARGVEVTTGEAQDVTGTGAAPSTSGGGGGDWGGLGKPTGTFPYWQPGRTGSSSYAPFTGGVWGGGGTLAKGGITFNDIRASGVEPRGASSVGAPNVGPAFMGTSGPSNLTWGQIGGEGQDRPHFNPYFGGYNQNAPSKGVGVALRAKGDKDVENTVQYNRGVPNTDTVPAMLTPREAVLNRNAAELAGRGNIEQLNAEGNKLAKKGVDLAQKGDTDVDTTKREPIEVGTQGSDEMRRLLGPWFDEFIRYQQAMRRGELSQETALPLEAGFERRLSGGGGNEMARFLHEKAMERAGREYQEGTKNVKEKAKKYQGGAGQVPLPAKAKNQPYNSIGGFGGGGTYNPPLGQWPPPGGGGTYDPPLGNWPPSQMPPFQWNNARPQVGGMPDERGRGQATRFVGGNRSARPQRGGGFYPSGMGLFQGGTEEVPPGAIGSPNPQHAYGPPITLTAPQLQMAAQKAGLSGGQIQGLMSAVQGFGQGYGELTGGGLGGGGTGGMDAAGAFQGGISDIGYPPFVAPQAEYHADKGSSWIGRYDPAYTLPIY